MKNTMLVLLAIVTLGSGLFIYRQYSDRDKDVALEKPATADTVANFDECVRAGNPIQETYPRRCISSVGTVFVENIPDTKSEATEYVSNRGVKITVSEPVSGALLKSPVTIKGSVPGNWSFEASFPINLLDSSGITIAQTTAQLQGDWMTDDYVPFEATLTFDTPVGAGNGTLILRKANPSDLSENNDSLLIPVCF
jgi:hypothetical protein